MTVLSGVSDFYSEYEETPYGMCKESSEISLVSDHQDWNCNNLKVPDRKMNNDEVIHDPPDGIVWEHQNKLYQEPQDILRQEQQRENIDDRNYLSMSHLEQGIVFFYFCESIEFLFSTLISYG